ncbi:hypothetical protein [Streptomyces sp. NPDC007172]|uniref:hypothetical protein n=1 Tax=Streptomyces sp. NPDC007172 TaxID=3364776 RepID=UPI0036A70BFB
MVESPPRSATVIGEPSTLWGAMPSWSVTGQPLAEVALAQVEVVVEGCGRPAAYAVPGRSVTAMAPPTSRGRR